MPRFLPLLLVAFILHPSSLILQAAERPNVLLIYTDDQGSMDLGCYGSEDLLTPNLDRLAARGVRFTRMYAPSAICSASRAGLMTGRFPARAGVPGNVSSAHGEPGMPPEEFTLAELLKDAGYRTHHVGKWHLGYTPETMPNAQGFDTSYGHMGGCIDNYSHFFFWNGPNRHDLWRDGREIWEDGVYFGDGMVREVTGAIDAEPGHPWFIYWAINWPHYPLQGTDKWRQAYKEKGLESPRDKYNAFVSTLDEIVGRVLDHLENSGRTGKTLVIFQSDHGHSTEERTFFSGGNPGPYRGAKGCLFEGGIRVPSIVSLPGALPEGETRDQLVTGCGWFATVAELCGVPIPADHHLDGKSFLDVIRNADAPGPHDHFYWQLGKGQKAQWAVTEGDWKLLGNPKDNSDRTAGVKLDSLFLANLAMDIGESENVAGRHPEIVSRLLEIRERHAASIEADQGGR